MRKAMKQVIIAVAVTICFTRANRVRPRRRRDHATRASANATRHNPTGDNSP